VHLSRELRSTAEPGELRQIWNVAVRGAYMIALDDLVRALADRR
jgi:hypothetical protein